MVPLVTVLMPVYNGEKYLKDAIQSILGQTFKNYEFLIIDDGSTDNTWEILNSFRDSRIRLIRNNRNVGPSKTRNIGLSIARGKYIASMDADDISLPKRLECQINYMENNIEVGISGTWLKPIGSKRYRGIWKMPVKYQEILIGLLFGLVLPHNTVIFRTETFKRYNLFYNSLYDFAEDFELWVRCSSVMKMANIPKALVLYRLHEKQVSTLKRSKQLQIVKKVLKTQIENTGVNYSKNDLDLHFSISNWSSFDVSYDLLNEAEKWLLKLIQANNIVKYYPEPYFTGYLVNHFFILCNRSVYQGNKSYKAFYRSALSGLSNIGYYKHLKLLIKSIIKSGF